MSKSSHRALLKHSVPKETKTYTRGNLIWRTLQIFRWLSDRRSEFTTVEFAQFCELSYPSAARWLFVLEYYRIVASRETGEVGKKRAWRSLIDFKGREDYRW